MRRVNVKLLAWLVGSTLVLGVGAHLLHGVQVKRNAKLLLSQADTAEKEGNLRLAAKSIAQYLKHEDDPQLYAKLAELYGEILKQNDMPPMQAMLEARKAHRIFEEALRRHPDLTEGAEVGG